MFNTTVSYRQIVSIDVFKNNIDKKTNYVKNECL